MLSRVRKNLEAGFTLIELMIVVAIIGILAVIAVPNLVRWVRHTKTAEAHGSLAKMGDGAAAWYQAEHYDGLGTLGPKAFPGIQMPNAGTAGGFHDVTPVWVPTGSCSKVAGEKCPGIIAGTNNNEFQVSADSEIWQALKFALASPHYYNYQFVPTGQGPAATFTAMACGDLNNDGPNVPGTCTAATQGLYQRIGRVDAEGGPSVGGIQISNEDE